MSNRTLIEINHDFHGQIQREPHEFVAALCRYLGSASDRTTEPLERFGIRILGRRHHSESYEARFGEYVACENGSHPVGDHAQWVLVPKDPPDEMFLAGAKAWSQRETIGKPSTSVRRFIGPIRRVYSAMWKWAQMSERPR